MGLAIAGMHYTAMSAASFYADPSYVASLSHQMHTTNQSIAYTVALVAIIVFITTVICSIVDTRLQYAERSIEKQIDREKDIIDSLADGLIIMGEDGQVETINQTGLAIFGYQESDIQQQLHINDIIPSFNSPTLFEDEKDNNWLEGSTKG
ncbi:PAS domain-containing protein [Vibrio sp.]|nr:PAS domain-containing protein [Vibrio sp.]